MMSQPKDAAASAVMRRVCNGESRVYMRSRTACAKERMLHDTFPPIDVTSGRSFKFVEETRSSAFREGFAAELRRFAVNYAREDTLIVSARMDRHTDCPSGRDTREDINDT